MTGKFRNTLLECIDIALMMEVALLFYSQIDLFSSSILFICLIKDKPQTVGARSLDKDGCAEEDDGDAIFVKYDRMLHGQDRRRGKKAKQDRLIVKFLKKYIHYAKNLIQPKLTNELTFSNPAYRAIQSWQRYYFSIVH